MNPMTQSIFDDLGSLDCNKLPGWSFIQLGASEIVPHTQSSEKKKPRKHY
jgi:hypothetical protein